MRNHGFSNSSLYGEGNVVIGTEAFQDVLYTVIKLGEKGCGGGKQPASEPEVVKKQWRFYE